MKKFSMTIPSQFDEMIGNRTHLALEKADAENRLDDIKAWLTDKTVSEEVRKVRLDFLNWHIKMTESIFGKWNWTKATM